MRRILTAPDFCPITGEGEEDAYGHCRPFYDQEDIFSGKHYNGHHFPVEGHAMDKSALGLFPGRLAKGLWVLGNYHFNLYLAKGEQAAALIEVGVSGMADEVIRQLEILQVAPSFLVVSHPHADHLTGIDALRERYRQALVIAGEGSAEFLAHPKIAASIIEEDRHMSDFLLARGFPPGRDPVEEAPLLTNSMVARDGDQMDLGGLTLRFLAVQGHSPGALAVHIPEIDAVMPSDSLGFRYPGRGFFPIFFTGYDGYVATLDRLRDLKPTILGSPHQGPLTGADVEPAFEESRRVAVSLREEIRNDPRDDEAIIEEIFGRYYRDELTMYTRENVMNCARLVVRRARE